jgi:hypothetical protein
MPVRYLLILTGLRDHWPIMAIVASYAASLYFGF